MYDQLCFAIISITDSSFNMFLKSLHQYRENVKIITLL